MNAANVIAVVDTGCGGMNISAEMFYVRFDVESSAVYNRAVIRLEQDIFAQQLASSGLLYVYQTQRFWSQIKSVG